MQFVRAQRDSGLRRDRALRAHRGRRWASRKLRRHRRRAAGAARSAGADRAAGGDSRHSRPGADHQRRAAGRAGASRCTTPGCGASTSTSTRSIASASSRSRAATICDKVLAGIEAARSGWASTDQAQRGGGEEPGGARYRAAGPLSRARTASKCATSSSCRSTRRISGTAARCCWPTRSSRCCRARSRR